MDLRVIEALCGINPWATWGKILEGHAAKSPHVLIISYVKHHLSAIQFPFYRSVCCFFFVSNRFNLVRQHFSTRLEHLRSKESSPHTMHSIISLLMGMKFFRVKVSSLSICYLHYLSSRLFNKCSHFLPFLDAPD